MDDVIGNGHHQEINWNGDTLPLYVKMLDGTYKIVSNLEAGMEFVGIATKRGLLLNVAISPSECKIRYVGLLNAEAGFAYPDARPLNEDDVFNCEDCVTDLWESSSRLFRTVKSLKEAGIELFDFSKGIVYLPIPTSYFGVGCRLYNLGGVSDTIGIEDVSIMYLFLDKECLPEELQAVFPTGVQMETSVKREEPVPPPLVGQTSRPLSNDAKKFPLELLLSNERGDRIRSYQLKDGYKVDGVILLGGLVVLQETIKPEATGKKDMTFHDLKVMADNAYRRSRPLYDEYACCPALLTLLLLERERYQKTAKMLVVCGIKMPSIDEQVYYTKGLFDDADYVDFVWVSGMTYGSAKISCVEEMILVAQASELLPLEYSEY